ncbi:MAG: hypothetical protein ACE5H1_00760 [Thermodesulfobacteriota bacterium]
MSWTWLRDERVKAKKVHKCLLCGEDIEVGEYYQKRTGTNDGIITMKMHEECKEESDSWDECDWQTFGPYEMERPMTNPNKEIRE